MFNVHKIQRIFKIVIHVHRLCRLRRCLTTCCRRLAPRTAEPWTWWLPSVIITILVSMSSSISWTLYAGKHFTPSCTLLVFTLTCDHLNLRPANIIDENMDNIRTVQSWEKCDL